MKLSEYLNRTGMTTEEYFKRKKRESEGKRTLRDVQIDERDDFISRLENLDKLGAEAESVYDSYRSRYFDENGSYKNTYLGDTDNAYNTFNTFKSKFDAESQEILNSFDKYSHLFSDEYVKNTKDWLTSWGENLNNMRSAYLGERYRYDTKKGQEELDAWEKILTNVSRADLMLKQYHGKDVTPDDMSKEDWERYLENKSWIDQYGSAEEVRAEVNNRRKYHKEAKRLQVEADFDNVGNSESDVYDPNFDLYVGKGNAIPYSEVGEQTRHRAPGGKGRVSAASIDDERAAALALYEHNGGEIPSTYRHNQEVIDRYRNFEDAEFKTLAYWMGYDEVNGTNKAAEYLAAKENTLNFRAGQDIYDKVEDSVALELAFGFAAGADQFASGLVNVFNTKDDYIAPTAVQYASGMVREDLNDAGAAQIGYDFITTTANMVPSILASAAVGIVSKTAGAALGATLMGASSAGNAYQDMLNAGYDKSQARTYSTLVGISEAGLQYALGGISKLGSGAVSKFTSNTLGKIAKGINSANIQFAIKYGGQYVGNVIGEGFEEALQEVLDPFFKSIATGEKPEGVDWEQVAYSGFLGALSAGVLEGGGSIATRVSEIGKASAIKNEGNVETLKNVGKTFSADSVAYKIADKVTENTGAYKLSMLLHDVNANLSEQNVQDIETALVEKGIASENAKSIAKWLGKAVDGAKFTKAQQMALEDNPIISQVFRDVIVDKNSTVNQRLQGMMELNGIEGQAGADLAALEESKPTAQSLSDKINFDNAIKQVAETAARQQYGLRTLSKSAQDTINDEVNSAINDMVSEENGVSVKKVSEISKNGVMKVQTDNGNVEDSSNIKYKSREEATLYISTANLASQLKNLGIDFDANAANAVISAFAPGMNIIPEKSPSGLSIDDYIMGVKEAIRYGAIGQKQNTIRKDGAYGELTKSQQDYFYNLGREIDKRRKVTDNKTTENDNNGGNTNGSENTEVLAERESVREADRGRNSQRKQSENSRKIQEWVGDRDNGRGTRKEIRAGSEGWIRGNGESQSDILRSGKSFLRDLSRKRLNDTDFAGRNLSEDLQEKFKDTVLKDKDGTILSLYHWTNAEFDSFEIGDIGFHFGTLDAAHARYQYIEKTKGTTNSIYKEVYLNIRNPVIIEFDPITWSTMPVAYKLNQQGIISDQELNVLAELDGFELGGYNSEAATALRELLSEKGYDGILYENGFEGGISAIAFDADQIYTVAENGIDKNAEPKNNKQKKGKVTKVIKSKLKPSQSTAVSTIEKLSKVGILKNNFYIFESEAKERIIDGKSVQVRVFSSDIGDYKSGDYAPNGIYQTANGDIYIDINSGIDGQGLTLYTLAHELGHFVKAENAAGFEILADFVADELGGEFEDLIQKKLEMWEQLGRTGLDYMDAREDVICDALEPMFTEGNLAQRLVEYSNATKEGKGLINTLRKFFSNLYARIQKAYAQLDYDDPAAKVIAKNKKAVGEIADLFAKTLVETTENFDNSDIQAQKNTTSEGDVKYSFRNTISGMANDELVPYDKELTHLIEQRGDHIVDSFEKLVQIVNLAFDNPQLKATVYFGVIPTETLSKIEKNIPNIPTELNGVLFKPNKTYSVAATLDSIQHLADDKELSRNDIVEYLDRMADTIIDFDTVNFDYYYKGKNKAKGIIFKKTFADGTMQSFEIVSNTKRTLNLQTLYMESGDYQKKKSAKTLLNQKASANAQGAGWSDSNNSIRNPDENVKENSESHLDRNYSYSVLVNKPDMKLTVIDGVIPSNRADIVAQAKKNASKIGKFNTKDGSVSVRVDDVDSDVIMSTAGLRHSLDRRLEVNAPIVLKAGEILQNSIRINELIPQKSEASESYVLIGAAKSSVGQLYIVRSVVNRFKNELVSMDVLYAINAKTEPIADNKKRNQPGDNPQDSQLKNRYLSDSTISIANLLDYVNKYFPDILPEDILKHYGHDSRPNGRVGKDALFSDRNFYLSSRNLLANALESTAKNDVEREWLGKYKEQIQSLNEDQKRLDEINAEIKEISFNKGTDRSRLTVLNNNKKTLTARITRADKKLLQLEAAKPLKRVLEVEKKRAQQKANERAKQIVVSEREKSLAKLEETKKRYQESRKKNVEGRQKTELRNKIKKTVKKLNHLLIHGSKEHNIKIELQDTARKAILAAEQLFDKDGGEGIVECLSKLRFAYDSLAKSENKLAKDAYNSETSQKIHDLQMEIGEYSLSELSKATLEKTYDCFKLIYSTITNVNKLFKDGKAVEISSMSWNTINEMEETGIEVKHNRSKKLGEAIDKINSFSWAELKPIYAFERLGSKTMMELYWDAVRADGICARNVDDAAIFMNEQKKKSGYVNWDLNKTKTFILEDGKEFKLTVSDIMSIYAYSKREQAHDHILKGGFMFTKGKTFTEGTGDKKKVISKEKLQNTSETYRLNADVLAQIVGTLTEEQRNYVEAMQDYLSSVMGEKGNEVSRVLYGIDLFKEKHYFPLKSSTDFLNSVQEALQKIPTQTSLKNIGMAKETVPHASNPIMLESFEDVWKNHVIKMSQYNAYVIPIENLQKVFNFERNTENGSVSVKNTINRVFGENASQYVDNWIIDLNGGMNIPGYKSPLMKRFATFKKVKTAASLTTTIQQYSAVVRATALVDSKYFISPKRLGKTVKLGELYSEMRKYAPVTIVKEIGGFDIGSTGSAMDYMSFGEYNTLKNKVKGFFTDKEYSKKAADDLFMAGAAAMDKLGWMSIWSAVKNEIASETNLAVGSTEFFDACSKRFTEVIAYTQVYDSVVSRSGIMRSKSELNKFATAFMGEPTTSINMLFNAALQLKRAKKGDKFKAFKNFSRTTGAVYGSIVLAALSASFVYALRDDEDEDESLIEKWAWQFGGKLRDEVNPLNMLPYARDVISIIQGFTIERPDMSLIADVVDTFKDTYKAVTEEPEEIPNAIMDLTQQIAALYGIPLGNIVRDFKAIVNGVRMVTDDIAPDYIGDAFVEGFTGGIT